MTKYKVSFSEIRTVSVLVEADSEEAAREAVMNGEGENETVSDSEFENITSVSVVSADTEAKAE